MALTGKITTEFGIKVPASKSFNFITNQLHHVQNITDAVHHAKVHEGDDWHSTDSVKHWSYTVDGKVTQAKEKIEAIDEHNKSITFILFDGDITQQYKLFNITIQVIDKEDGNAVIKWTVEYEKINEDVAPPYGYLAYLTKLTKDADAHLLQT
ncbi:START-like domain superfamily [Sesbania bispinosa]|nr:START-like domain superfamily [Sesbania bispinosa]